MRQLLPLLLAACSAGRPPAVAPTVTLASLGVDEANLDRAADPCDDFYQYACGGWLARTPIPADEATWGSFSAIEERNLALLRTTLEADAAGKGHADDPYRDKLGDLWASCMDEARVDAAAPAAIKAILARVDRVTDVPAMAAFVAEEHLGLSGPLFGFSSQQDFAESTQVVGSLDQGGLGLPDRDYYLKDEGEFPKQRKEYEAHVGRTLVLAGLSEADARASAATVMRIERTLAEASMPRVERRDPKKLHNRLNLAGIEQRAPRFPWRGYLAALGHGEITEINVQDPAFFTALDDLLGKVPMADWRAYLRWHAVSGAATSLSRALDEEHFAFYGKTLGGLKEQRPRWKRCVDVAGGALGEALGQSFVRQSFGADGKSRSREMVAAIEAAMKADVAGLPWMDAATREQAFAKLATIVNKIGYPDRWRAYDGLAIDRASYHLNRVRASVFENHRQLRKIGKPVDRAEWEMAPQEVNAYYEASKNEIAFPAGILQPPFFQRAARDAVNYGAIGMVIGHELTHGFDDEGRQFDGSGNLRDWWSPSVSKEFEQRAACVARQFDALIAVDDVHLNGKLTLGENIADLGGIKLAHHAFVATHRPDATKRAGFTDEQLFFLGTAQAWCGKVRPETARMYATVDPHAPPKHRVNAPLSNLPEFAAAFSCRAGSRMVRADLCTVW